MKPPSEMATEFVNDFISDGLLDKKMGLTSAKKCATISVIKIIKYTNNCDKALIYDDKDGIVYTTFNSYWSDVLTYINKLE